MDIMWRKYNFSIRCNTDWDEQSHVIALNVIVYGIEKEGMKCEWKILDMS